VTVGPGPTLFCYLDGVLRLALETIMPNAQESIAVAGPSNSRDFSGPLHCS
jgi:hypothetical protein